ncbi:MAG: TonB-dependent receptor plug domain-containing protein [Tenuifilaceae bacterium]|jgi:hypothetical protein|nr:TonB-dependent receptor plug domain-containing protein [Tenuifilaceae bacterium]
MGFKRLLSLHFLISFNICVALSQPFFFVVSGKVIDADTELEIEGAKVSLPVLSKTFQTNSDGTFKFALSQGAYFIEVEKNEYQLLQVNIDLRRDTFLLINLKTEIKQTMLDEIVIVGNRKVKIEELNSGLTTLSQIDVQNIPTLGGEKDIVKGIQSLPGVQQSFESSAGLVVRGGSPDQNLYLLDNVRIYNTNHCFGLLSSYNPSMVKSVDFYRGGFPSKFSGFVSSVLDVKSKNGVPDRIEGSIDLGLISSSANFSSKISDNGGIIISGRRTFLDLLSKIETDQGLIPYKFFDFSTKLIYKSRKHLFNLLYSTSKDVMVFDQGNKLGNKGNVFTNKWGTDLVSFSIESSFTNEISNELQIYYSDYKFSSLNEYYGSNSTIDFSSEIISSISTLGFSNNTQTKLSENLKFSFGGNVLKHFYKPAYIVGMDSSKTIEYSYIPNANVIESGFFGESKLNLPFEFSLMSGIRYDIFIRSSHTNAYLQGRFLLQKKIYENLFLKFSFTQNIQGSHYLSNSGMGVPVDVWLPSVEIFPEQKAWQFTAGIYSSISDYTFTLECFYKKMNNIITYKDGHSSADFLLSYNNSNLSWGKSIAQGRGESKGVEFFLEKPSGRLTGWFSYTLSWATNKFEMINNGKEYWSPYDRRHVLSIVFSYKLLKKWRANINWQFMSGQPVTLPIYYYLIENNEIINGSSFGENVTLVWGYGERNNSRMIPTHHLDISFKREINKEKFKGSIEVGCYNVYGRKNPYYYFGKIEINENGDKYGALKAVSIFPAIPYFSFKWYPFSTFNKLNKLQ